jgi:heterodisulfide reductase subunit A
MVSFTLNGKTVQAQENEYLLKVAQREGVDIPTLCHHPALEPAGMCRLCTVELFDGRRTKFVTACNYPVWEGMQIQTDTQMVRDGRKMIIELLLSRCANEPALKKLAQQYGIDKPRFPQTTDDCILCGLCVRVCERMGNSAIQLTERGVDLKVDTPFHIQTEACIACGACASLCPTGCITIDKIKGRFTKRKVEILPSEYDQGLIGRKPIYVPYAQAIPNTPAIDRSKCVYFKTGGCQICKEICPVNAIDHDTKDEFIELDVGAVVLTSGFASYDPRQYDLYGYQRYANVMTSLEFERMLSASGPFGGHVVRPSDHAEPKKIAWLQCVGSRDEHPGAGKYCSAVCCTYAVKEAVMAKEHVPGLDAAIFYIDMRTQGKDFETYYTRARDKSGVRFVKSRIANVSQSDKNGQLKITYTDPEGHCHSESFDILVLSVGMCLSKDTARLSQTLGFQVNSDGFPATGSFAPVNTSQPNILVCGGAHSPQDIPSSVVNASAAAGTVSAALADARWSCMKTKQDPVEEDISGIPPRVGVFVCHCGTNIAGAVDVQAVVEYARKLPFVVYANTNLFSCSQDTQLEIADVIKEQKLNRVVVAACTPRTHEAIFQETMKAAGLNKYTFEMANIRNHCSWVHANQPHAATQKSIDLVRMAVEKATLLKPLFEQKVEIQQAALVIGGGLAGLTAAKNLADQGFDTHLVEKADRLGGQANHILETWQGEDVAQNLALLIEKVESDKKIQIHLNSQVKTVSGSLGRFTTTLANGENETEVAHGTAIIATGGLEYKPKQHLYGQDPRVMTALELDAVLKSDAGDITNCGSVAFLQCVGSRIPERPYCSKVCCTHSVKSALTLKARNPDMEIYIIYRDMRTYGLRENLYHTAREKGIHFVRFNLENGLEVKNGAANLSVTFTDSILNRRLTLKPDRMVLATAIVEPGNTVLSQAFKVPVNADGFFNEAHVKLRPVDFATDGVFVCGLAHGPKPIDETIAQAQAAAARAAVVLSKPSILVGGKTAHIETTMCTGCEVCVQVCPYSAIDLNDKARAEVNPALCKGCGLCSASCRSSAAMLEGATDAEVLAQISALAV